MCRKLLRTSYRIPRQFEGHLACESVRITPLAVTEASFCCALFRVFMAHVRHNLEQRVYTYDYVKKKSCLLKNNLHIRPYKVTVVPEMKPVDYEKKREVL
jgi:hypothetical protein